jgi:hypothetical protein
MTKALPLPGDEVADEICRDCGYEPELKRSLNGPRCWRR